MRAVEANCRGLNNPSVERTAQSTIADLPKVVDLQTFSVPSTAIVVSLPLP